MRYVRGVEFPGEWDDREAHARFVQEAHRRHPGWVVEGYAIAEPAESQVEN